MKVAFASTILTYPWGGADSLWTTTAESAAQRGDHLFLALSPLTSAHPRILHLVGRGATIHRRDERLVRGGIKKRLMRWCSTLSTRPAIFSALERFSPDILCLCQGGTFDFLVEPLLIDWLKATQLPYVLICQSNDAAVELNTRDQALAHGCFESAAATIFVSKHNLLLAQQQSGSSIPRAHVVYNPTSHTGLTGLPWPPSPPYRMATVSRIESRDKGLDLLIPALAGALGESAEWHLDIFGQGPDTLSLQKMAHGHGLADRIAFCGHTTDIAALWREHHLLLLPSRLEGCSLAMMEALLCGRPVLATPVGGVDEWIKDRISGFVCRDISANSLTETLKACWDARHQWENMGQEARQHALTLTKPHPCSDVLTLFDQATQNSTRKNL
ncbi:MAG: glycosyltransferase family 4 protein [Candidatus Methylacidiphilales bacterium]|nr:glycosyltransferase family 4 protein [Candidatus Methylacidiphilales bacterium]